MYPGIKGFLRYTLSALPLLGAIASAAEVRGVIDLRAVATDTRASWTNAGLDKARFDDTSTALRLGQALLRADTDLSEDFSASAVLNVYDDRDSIIDVTEAWVSWNPVPQSAWRTRIKAGAFFPVASLEVGYDSVGWTPVRTLSSSAINSWLGEEIRTKGIELALLRRGVFDGSAHDFGLTAAIFGGNDPAGTLLGWRGWSIGDRITGLSESLKLADLPVYRPGGDIPAQTRHIHVFREIDNRPGYYIAANYGYSGWIEAAATHYDNRGRPLEVEDGQYSWHTRFDHVSARIHASGNWEFLFQGITGRTEMGPSAVDVEFSAWYFLVSRQFGVGQLTLRRDEFQIEENDVFPSDPNGEKGSAWALSYAWPLTRRMSFMAEGLEIRSTRPARELIGYPSQQTERSLTAAIRWEF